MTLFVLPDNHNVHQKQYPLQFKSGTLNTSLDNHPQKLIRLC